MNVRIDRDVLMDLKRKATEVDWEKGKNIL